MKRMFKYLFLLVILVLFLVCSNNVFAAEVNPNDIKSKLENNSETKGKKFKVGMMGNYYKICLTNNSAYVYRNVKILKCSDTRTISELGENGLQRTKNILESNVVGFSVNLPRGYGYTLLYALGLSDDSKTNDTFRDTTDLNVKLSNHDTPTICLTEVVDSSTYYSDIDKSQTKATLYLVGDVVEVTLTVKQYQSWWWGDQPLYSEEVTAYVICNLYDYVEYTR